MRIELPQLNKTLQSEKGANLFKTLKDAGVPIASSCNGDGVCGKCVILVEKGLLLAPNAVEQKLQEKYDLESGQRISCQCTVVSDIRITTTYW